MELNVKTREVKAVEDTLKATTANLAQAEELANALKENVEKLDLEISFKTMVHCFNISYLIYFNYNFVATTIRRRTERYVPSLRRWR
jgi:hypothetical protein